MMFSNSQSGKAKICNLLKCHNVRISTALMMKLEGHK